MQKYISILKNTNMFHGINEAEILSMLSCLDAKVSTYTKDSYIIRSGEQIHSRGMILSGLAMIEKIDYWGSRTIIQEINSYRLN